MSFNSSSGVTRKLTVTIIMSVLYGAISVSLDPDFADFITEQDFGDIRPAIFFPAIIAIIYGPLVGAFTAGMGNLIYDSVTTIYFSGESLGISDTVGFAGNFVGAMIVGIFSKPYRYNNDPFSYRGASANNFKDYFNLIFIRRLVRNTLAAVIGLSFVTAIIIGYGTRLQPQTDPQLSFLVFTSIAYWNGLFLLVAIPIIYTVISVLDYIQVKREVTKLEKRRNLEVKVSEEVSFEFERIGSPKGDELWNLEWGAMNMVLRNNDTTSHKYMVRVASNDIFSPHRHTTAELEPNTTDELYFNIYGITAGQKKSSIFVKVDDQPEEVEIPFIYEMGSSNELVFRKIMGLLLLIAFGVSIALIILNIRDNLVLDTATIFALAALPVEIITVLLFYIIWNNRRTKQLFEAMGLRKGEKVETPQIMESVLDDDNEELKRRITRTRIWSTLFLLLSVPIFGVIGYIIVLEQLGRGSYSGDLIIAAIVLLIMILSISDYFLEQGENIQKQILNHQEKQNKIIRKAVTTGKPEVFKTTQIYLKVFNPFPTRGMRIFFHSIDNITPQEIEIEDIQPQTTKLITIDFTSLQDGKRKIGMEVVQYSNNNGDVIPIEKANTFDQEVVELVVSNTRVLGLSKGQISVLRGSVTGIGSFSIAVTFIANLFGYRLDQQFLQNTLPLLIILQIPVLWLSLFLQDKIKNSLNFED